MPRLASLRLAPKIGLSIALFLLPVMLILVLLAGVQNKDITFASMEVTGTQAWPCWAIFKPGSIARCNPARLYAARR